MFRLIIAFVCLLSVGCTALPSVPTPQSDLTALAKLIRLDWQPLSAQWLTESLPLESSALGPSDWRLVALLTYDEATLGQLKQALIPLRVSQMLQVRPDFIRAWFPEPIRARFQPDPSTGNLLWQGERYQPAPFLKPPLLTGFVLIAKPHVLIVLHTR